MESEGPSTDEEDFTFEPDLVESFDVNELSARLDDLGYVSTYLARQEKYLNSRWPEVVERGVVTIYAGPHPQVLALAKERVNAAFARRFMRVVDSRREAK